jgi:hypothetical protein
MTDSSLPTAQKHHYIIKLQSEKVGVQTEQDRIYSFFLRIIQQWTPTEVLQEFQHLFIDCILTAKFAEKPGIYVVFDEQEDFYYTIKRCCYILINNWETSRQYQYIQELVTIIENYQQRSPSHTTGEINICQTWLNNFINSPDYKQIKLFASRYKQKSQQDWVSRYTPYLLVAQSYNQDNSPEQREAARKLSQQMKDKYKFELAMYVAYSQSSTSKTSKYTNPSILGDDILRIIKIIVNKKGAFSYVNIANIFIQQTENQTLGEFKDSIQKYLLFSSMEPPAFVESVRKELAESLSTWKLESNDEIINPGLFLRTCNRLVDFLTTDHGKEPSKLCLSLLTQGHSLTLVVLLLKIILISKNSRAHLEVRIAQLINYYEKFPVDECKWLINFMEIFNITFAIYAENVQYSLVNMKDNKEIFHSWDNLDDYRVFSQLKLSPESTVSESQTS